MKKKTLVCIGILSILILALGCINPTNSAQQTVNDNWKYVSNLPSDNNGLYIYHDNNYPGIVCYYAKDGFSSLTGSLSCVNLNS